MRSGANFIFLPLNFGFYWLAENESSPLWELFASCSLWRSCKARLHQCLSEGYSKYEHYVILFVLILLYRGLVYSRVLFHFFLNRWRDYTNRQPTYAQGHCSKTCWWKLRPAKAKTLPSAQDTSCNLRRRGCGACRTTHARLTLRLDRVIRKSLNSFYLHPTLSKHHVIMFSCHYEM